MVSAQNPLILLYWLPLVVTEDPPRLLEGSGCQWFYPDMVKCVLLQHARQHVHRCNCGITIMGATSSFQIKFKAHSTGGAVFGTVSLGKTHS